MEDAGPRVAGVEDAGGLYRRFGTTKFALPEFAGVTKCAYFDYQRDKVLCRASPRVKKTARGKKRRNKQVWKVNRQVEWVRPAACPHRGSTGFDTQSKHEKPVIDLKPFRCGVKRQVTRHKARRYRCRSCLGTFLPADYAVFDAFGRVEEHMYEFQLGKGPMDPKGTRYILPTAYEGSGGGPPPAGRVGSTAIDSLGLKVGDHFGYWFDFGDDWWRQINVEGVGEAAPKGKYPKVTKKVGKSPPQYADEE